MFNMTKKEEETKLTRYVYTENGFDVYQDNIYARFFIKRGNSKKATIISALEAEVITRLLISWNKKLYLEMDFFNSFSWRFLSISMFVIGLLSFILSCKQ